MKVDKPLAAKYLTQLRYLGFTAILVGYLTVWLPNQAAGLALLGIEIGEWIKLLPEAQSGQVWAREIFYLPPIALGLFLALQTNSWSNKKWQTWVMRGLAIGVSLLTMPALEAIRFEGKSEWLTRILLIGFVILIAGSVTFLPPQIAHYSLIPIGLIGGALPTVLFWQVQGVVSYLLGTPLGVGLGVWLNLIGHLLVVVSALLDLKGFQKPLRS